MKNKIDEMEESIRERWARRGEIPVWRVFLLAEMVNKGVWPDARFSDDECSIWAEFRRLMGRS